MDISSEYSANKKRTESFILYVLIAYTISWAIEIPLALKAKGIISTDIPFSIHYLAAFGPFIASLLLTWRDNRAYGLKELFQRTFKWRVHPLWWIVAISPILLFFLVSLILRIFQGSWISLSILGRFDFLPDLGVWVIFIWLATYGFGEELGWRGYLLPRLQRNLSALSATIILWIIWAIWHIPSFFYLHTASSPGMVIGFLIGIFTGAVFLTWLYNSSGGSVLIVAVWHGLFDYVTACTECKSGLVAALISTLIMIWAIIVVFLYKGANLSHKAKHTL